MEPELRRHPLLQRSPAGRHRGLCRCAEPSHGDHGSVEVPHGLHPDGQAIRVGQLLSAQFERVLHDCTQQTQKRSKPSFYHYCWMQATLC